MVRIDIYIYIFVPKWILVLCVLLICGSQLLYAGSVEHPWYCMSIYNYHIQRTALHTRVPTSRNPATPLSWEHSSPLYMRSSLTGEMSKSREALGGCGILQNPLYIMTIGRQPSVLARGRIAGCSCAGSFRLLLPVGTASHSETIHHGQHGTIPPAPRGAANSTGTV